MNIFRLSAFALLILAAPAFADAIPAEFVGVWKFKAMKVDGREYQPNETNMLAINADATMQKAPRPEDLGHASLLPIHITKHNELYTVAPGGQRTLVGTLSIDKKGRLELVEPGDSRSAQHLIYEKTGN